MKRIASALSLLVALAGCRLTMDADPGLDASATQAADAGTPRDGGGIPGLLTIRGRVCTHPAITSLKIQFLIDSSGSMCLTDGPGAAATSGFCDTVAAQLKAQGVTVPGRVRALKTLMQHLSLQDGVSVALVPFDVQIQNAYPATGFVPTTDPQLTTRIDALQNSLGSGTDHQGALAAARRRIEDDLDQVEAAGGKDALARTRYVTIFVSDGFPYPRCSANDQLTNWASAADPVGTWQDNPATFCNTPPAGADAGMSADADNPECLGTGCPPDAATVYSDVIPDFPIGGDRNQNAQLFAEVDAMAALQEARGVAEIRLDAVMLYQPNAVALCGPICEQDLYAPPGGTAEDGRGIARWTLKQLATHGHGRFQEYADASLISFGWLDSGIGTFARWPRPMEARVYEGPKTPATGAVWPPGGEMPIRPDADGDGFPDEFEAAHAAEGFDPAVPDLRGCKAFPGVKVTHLCDDQDGDGLSEALEAYLGTNAGDADSDGDGLDDGHEVENGGDPLVTNEWYGREYDPPIEEAQADGTTCYVFKLGASLDTSGQLGRTYITVPFDQVRASSVYSPGIWRQACLFADGKPASGQPISEIVLEDSDFVPMWRFGAEVGQVLPHDYAAICKGVPK